MLTLRDFWPPVQGGWEHLDGVFVAAAHVADAWGARPDHPDLVGAEDESAVEDFLEGIAVAKRMVPPERVVWFSKELVRPSSLAAGLTPGWYAFWPHIGPQVPDFPKAAVVGPLKVSYRYPRFIPAGADLVLSVFMFVAVAATAWVMCI